MVKLQGSLSQLSGCREVLQSQVTPHLASSTRQIVSTLNTHLRHNTHQQATFYINTRESKYHEVLTSNLKNMHSQQLLSQLSGFVAAVLWLVALSESKQSRHVDVTSKRWHLLCTEPLQFHRGSICKLESQPCRKIKLFYSYSFRSQTNLQNPKAIQGHPRPKMSTRFFTRQTCCA